MTASLVTERVRCGDLAALHLDERPADAEVNGGFGSMALAFVLLQVGGTIPIPLWVLWQGKLGFGTGTLALVFAVYALGTLTSLVFLVPLSDQLGRRPALSAAIGLAAASTGLYLTVDSLPLLFLARFISGLAVALATAAGAAALRELEPGGRARRASLVATAITLGGLGLGALFAGLLAQYAGQPLALVFWLYLLLLIAAFIAVRFADETVPRQRPVRWKPARLALPARAQRSFVVSAAAGFCAFALLGLFSSVVPSFLGTVLHERNHAVAGIIVSSIFLTATLAQLLLRQISPTTAYRLGLPLLLMALALIELGLWQASLGIFVAGTLIGGVAAGLAFMGSLAAVNQIAEPQHRGQVLAAYFAATYAGLAIPAIGVGEATGSVGARDATLYCALVLAALALLALAAVQEKRPTVPPRAQLSRSGTRP